MSDNEAQDRELLEMLDDIKIRIGDDTPFFDTPPDDVWASIEAELTVDDAPPVVITNQADDVALQSTQSNVTSLDHHRRKRRPVGALLGAVAAAVVAAIAIPALRGPSETTIAEVALDSLGAGSAIGDATVVDDGDGSLRLDIEFLSGFVGSDSQYELWVIDNEVQEMHSLGLVYSEGEGFTLSYDLPEGVDIDDFPIIDISLEPNDGNPAHSGDSKYRGVVST